MNTKIAIDFHWIPHRFGGHRRRPFEGMRTPVRWQQYHEEFEKNMRTVQWEEIVFDKVASQGSAVCRFAFPDPVPSHCLEVGQLVEMHDGFRLIAIGRIKASKTSQS